MFLKDYGDEGLKISPGVGSRMWICAEASTELGRAWEIILAPWSLTLFIHLVVIVLPWKWEGIVGDEMGEAEEDEEEHVDKTELKLEHQLDWGHDASSGYLLYYLQCCIWNKYYLSNIICQILFIKYYLSNNTLGFVHFLLLYLGFCQIKARTGNTMRNCAERLHATHQLKAQCWGKKKASIFWSFWSINFYINYLVHYFLHQNIFSRVYFLAGFALIFVWSAFVNQLQIKAFVFSDPKVIISANAIFHLDTLHFVDIIKPFDLWNICKENG